MNYIGQIEKISKKNNGIITFDYCKANKISTTYLSRLTQRGTLNKVMKGIYLSKNGDYDEFYFFQYKYRKAISSYETAFYPMGFTDKIIQTIDRTVNSSYKNLIIFLFTM